MHAFGFDAFGFVSVRLNWNLTLISSIECKFSSTPKPARGFHEAMVDLEADRGFVIAPVREAFDLSHQRAGVAD